ncbi:MAG: hypothetical protein NXI20_27675 [bacterium]|nr:hypothetical protein [bacterium]
MFKITESPLTALIALLLLVGLIWEEDITDLLLGRSWQIKDQHLIKEMCLEESDMTSNDTSNICACYADNVIESYSKREFIEELEKAGNSMIIIEILNECRNQ